MISCFPEPEKNRSFPGREEVETRKIGRNETRTFQGLFPGCARVNKKLGKEPDMIVSFLMKRAWRADYLFLFPRWKRNTWISNVSFGFRFNSVPFGFVLVRVRVQPPKVGAPQEIGLRISVDHCLVGAITKTLIEIKVLVKHMGIQ